MYSYSKGIDNIKSLEKVNIYLSDNKSTCMSLTGALEARKPSQGLYIEDGNVMLLNVCERIENADKTYKLNNYSTNIQSLNTTDYVERLDLQSNKVIYKFDDIRVYKSFCFEKGKSILQIKYVVENNTDSKVEFYISPLLTYRDFVTMKKEGMLKFNQRKTDGGTIANLSVTGNVNLIMKSKELKYSQEIMNICNIKHEFCENVASKEEIYEDVFKTGEFKGQVKKAETKEFNLYISSKDFELDDVLNRDLFTAYKNHKAKVIQNIEKEFVELQDLALGMDICDMGENIISTLPYSKNSLKLEIKESGIRIDEILELVKMTTEIVKSIEGRYLSLNKVKEAKVLLIKVRRFIKEIDGLKMEELYALKEVTLLKLWFVESINRLYTKDSEIGVFVPQIKDIIVDTLNCKSKELILEDLECVALLYNAMKIYDNMASAGLGEEIIAYNTYKKLEGLLENEFWVPEKNVLKSNINEPEGFANISMLYTISLSYPCIIGNMKMKILDTIFRELYTPYGLREISNTSPKYNGNIYPKYMAHFLKANFRQNGVTRASQKLAYNLVKELLQDVSKYENCGIKKVYNDKGLNIDSVGYDILTNAEMIRVYNMLI